MDRFEADGAVLSGERIERINAHIGTSIKPSLYLAAYYAPKAHAPDSDYEGLFWCAVTNAYSLFADCMPRIKRKYSPYGEVEREGLADLLRAYDLLTYEAAQEIIDCCDTINNLRSVYCHNTNADVSADCGERMRRVYDFFAETGIDVECDEPFFSIPRLPPERWRLCFRKIRDGVERCLDSVERAVREAAGSGEKEEIAAKWERLLAQWLAGGKFTYSAVKGELAAKTICIRHSRKPELHDHHVQKAIRRIKYGVVPSDSQDKNQTEWMVVACARIINASERPALPYDVIRALFDTYAS